MDRILYPVLAEHDPQADAWSILSPDFPEIASMASDPSEIASQAHDAIMTAVMFRRQDGVPLPDPTPDPAVLTAGWTPPTSNMLVFVMVEAAAPEPEPVRINISIERTLLERIDAAAEHGGMTRSGFLADAAKSMLAKRAKTPTSARPSPPRG